MAEEPPQALLVAGAGQAGANGIYRAARTTQSGAPVYEHTETGAVFRLTREPHTSAKTGKTKHGWVLGKSGVPLYGVQTESLAPPMSGWKVFSGAAPVPAVRAFAALREAFLESADSARREGEAAADREQWHEALRALSCSLDALRQAVGDGAGEQARQDGSLPESISSRAAMALVRRAAATAALEEHRAALRDAAAALELSPGVPRAEAIALAALASLGYKDDEAARSALRPAGSGTLLKEPWALDLRGVEQWVAVAAEVAVAKSNSAEQGRWVPRMATAEPSATDASDAPPEADPKPGSESLRWLLQAERAVCEELAAVARAEAEAEVGADTETMLPAAAPAAEAGDVPGKAPQHVQLEVTSPSGHKVSFKVAATKPMKSWMDKFCRCWDLEEAQVSFLVAGSPLQPDDTAAALGLGSSEGTVEVQVHVAVAVA